MGWASGAGLLDDVMKAIGCIETEGTQDCVSQICDAFEWYDLDCWYDLIEDHPMIKTWAKEEHPDWFEDDE